MCNGRKKDGTPCRIMFSLQEGFCMHHKGQRYVIAHENIEGKCSEPGCKSDRVIEGGYCVYHHVHYGKSIPCVVASSVECAGRERPVDSGTRVDRVESVASPVESAEKIELMEKRIEKLEEEVRMLYEYIRRELNPIGLRV